MAAPGDIGPDHLRASDAERDEVLAELRDNYAAGRLSHDTFAHRMEAVLSARFRGELGTLRTDLPRPRRLGAVAVAAARRALAATDRWLRRYPAALTLPTGKQDRFTIGREHACDMRLTDTTVSRWHACLKREENGWLLTDLGSTNGTRLNGWRVNAPITVGPGDLVSFGAATFVLTERPGRLS
ncbi:MAG: FHA domain-containing protein [Streptosporangiaceae bacterium]